jgi:SAM-dependent methyltransferase
VPGSLLEVGVGTGVVAVGLRDLGWQVSGVDVAEPMVALAAQRLGDSAVQLGDAMDLPFDDDVFDNVVAAHLLHLVDDMALAIAEAARVLRPGGRLLALHGYPIGDRDDLAEATALLEPLQQDRPDSHAGLAAAAAAAGLRTVVQDCGQPMTLAMSPSELARNITERRMPYLFEVDEATWRELVEPSLEALRKLEGQDRQRRTAWRIQRSVFEL